MPPSQPALASIRSVAARGVTVLIIEHLMKVVLSLCRESSCCTTEN